MKIVKKIAIVLLVIFFCFISFLSFLFLSRNKYGVIDIGSNLYVTISEDNKSDVFDNGSLVVVEKKDFSHSGYCDSSCYGECLHCGKGTWRRPFCHSKWSF